MCRRRLQLPLARQRLPAGPQSRRSRRSSGPISRSAARTAPTRSCSCTPIPSSRRPSSCRSRATCTSRSPATARTRSTPRSKEASKAAGRRWSPNTVQQLTGLKIDHFLYVDLAGFQGVIDELGGVDMCITGENVNTPGYVESETADGTISEVYYKEPGHIVDPRTGLDVKPGCQRLPSDQALAYVRTRHLKCDSAAPDFYRIQRQQQFLRSVINRLLQPEQLAQLPLMIKPILSNLRRDEGLNPAELAYLTGQLQGISSGATEFRTVPAYPDPSNLGILRMDPVGRADLRRDPAGQGSGNGRARTPCTRRRRKPPCRSWSSITRPAARSTQVTDVLSQAGFDITPGVTTYPEYAKKLAGNVIAYAPDADAKAQVVAKYFPNLELKEVEGLPDDVVVFVDATYKPAPVGGGSDGRVRPVRSRTSDASPGVVGRRGLPAAPDHAHQRQATDPGRRHPDPVPRPGGDRRRRHHRGGHHRGSDRRRGSQRGGRWVPLGSAGHVHPAGRAVGPGPRRDHRARVRAGPAVPDVPGRQRAARRAQPVRPGVRAEPARRADLRGARPRARTLRRGGARRRPGGAPRGEASRVRERPRARRRLPVRRFDPGGRRHPGTLVAR